MPSEAPILPGAEPFTYDGGPTGILLIHGFTGTTQSMRYLGQRLHAAGHTVVGPRLPGHGVSAAAMAASTAADWIGEVDAALTALSARCGPVHVAGLSMGGTLALYLAATRPTLVKGVIPINAAVQIESPGMAALAFGTDAPATVPGIGADLKDTSTTELAYREVPVPAIRQLFGLVATTRALLSQVTCPTLILNSRVDHVVDPRNAHWIATGVGADRVELVWLAESYHVATIDHDKDRIADEIQRFMRC